MNKGMNLCNNIEDFTFAQYYFTILAENEKIKEEIKNNSESNNGIHISSGESIKEIFEKLRMLK